MKTSTEGLIALICHEGIVLTRYKDSVGVWTIGVGHTAAAGGLDPRTFTGTLRMAEAIELLRTDIVKYEADVIKAVKVPLKQHEFDALVSFHYNTGAISRSTLTKSLNAGDRKKAGKEFLNYLKPPEIAGRRHAEATLFLTGEYPPPQATAYPATKEGQVLLGKGTPINVRDLLRTPKLTIPPEAPTAAKPAEAAAPTEPKPAAPMAADAPPQSLFPPQTPAAASKKGTGWFSAAVSLALMILKGSKP